MKVLYSWLKDYADFKGSASEAARLLTEHAYEVRGVETIGKDAVLDVDVLANRAADSLSHIGIARELAASAGVAFSMPPIELYEKGGVASLDVAIVIEDQDLCPRYIGRVIRNVVVGESPAWLKNRLEALGQRSINNVVDVTNYTMLEYGQPLHAFDHDKLQGEGRKAKKIDVRRARKGETITTLDDEMVSLTSEMLVVADVGRPIALAGIKGGREAEITKDTTTIVLESASFDPVSVRRTARSIGIQTESSRRFEAGIDLVRPVEAIDRAAQLIAEVSGGVVASGRVDVGRQPQRVTEITVRPEEAQMLLGAEIEVATMELLLKRLHFSARQEAGLLVVTPPSFRRDVLTAPDVIEEVARLYGYNAIPSTPPLAHLVPLASRQDYDVEILIRDTLVGLGMNEARTHSFLSMEEIDRVCGDVSVVLIENALSNDLVAMRASLLPGLLKAAGCNTKMKKQFGLFEIGVVFAESAEEEVPLEEKRLAGIFVHPTGDGQLYYEAKGALEALLDTVGIAENRFNPMVHEPLPAVPGRSADIYVGEICIGSLNEINEETKKFFGVDAIVVAFEISLPSLISEVEGGREYTPFSRYPAVVRDVAVIVPNDVKVSSLLNVIESSGVQWVTDVDLFDMYDSNEVGDHQKSLAFHIIYQSADTTLTDKEVNAEHQKVVDALVREGWEVR